MAQNALAVRQSEEVQVNSMGELRQLAESAAGSRFFGAATPDQALMIMLAGKDLGFSYTQALRSFHVINGRPTLSADAMVAICKASPDCEKFERVEETATSVTWAAKRRGEREQSCTFTLEDAKRAGLLEKRDSNWSKYPTRMLNARAKAFLARDLFPDLLAGLLEDSEAADIAPRRVESDVRHVPEARPTPAPESGPREAVVSDFDRLATRVYDAMELADLDAVAVAIKAASGSLSADQMKTLRADFSRARERILASHEATAQTPDREPGEEG